MAERGVMRTHLPAANTAGVVQDYNPYIEPYRNARPSQEAGAGQIFAQKTYALPDIVAALNREGVRTPAGEPWTERNFQDTFRELGKLAFG